MWLRLILLLLAVLVGLVTIDRIAPEPRICPYRVYDWTVYGPGGEYGIYELGYLAGPYPSIPDLRVTLGPLGQSSLLLATGQSIVLLLGSLYLVFARTRHRRSITFSLRSVLALIAMSAVGFALMSRFHWSNNLALLAFVVLSGVGIIICGGERYQVNNAA